MFLDYTAAAASSSLVQHSVVTLTSAATIKHTTAAGAAAHGIMQSDPTSTGHSAAYRVFGESLVRPTSRAVKIGDRLCAGTGGKVQATTANTGLFVIGFAREAIAASTGRGANDVIKAHITLIGSQL